MFTCSWIFYVFREKILDLRIFTLLEKDKKKAKKPKKGSRKKKVKRWEYNNVLVKDSSP